MWGRVIQAAGDPVGGTHLFSNFISNQRFLTAQRGFTAAPWRTGGRAVQPRRRIGVPACLYRAGPINAGAGRPGRVLIVSVTAFSLVDLVPIPVCFDDRLWRGCYPRLWRPMRCGARGARDRRVGAIGLACCRVLSVPVGATPSASTMNTLHQCRWSTLTAPLAVDAHRMSSDTVVPPDE